MIGFIMGSCFIGSIWYRLSTNNSKITNLESKSEVQESTFEESEVQESTFEESEVQESTFEESEVQESTFEELTSNKLPEIFIKNNESLYEISIYLILSVNVHKAILYLDVVNVNEQYDDDIEKYITIPISGLYDHNRDFIIECDSHCKYTFRGYTRNKLDISYIKDMIADINRTYKKNKYEYGLDYLIDINKIIRGMNLQEDTHPKYVSDKQIIINGVDVVDNVLEYSVPRFTISGKKHKGYFGCIYFLKIDGSNEKLNLSDNHPHRYSNIYKFGRTMLRLRVTGRIRSEKEYIGAVILREYYIIDENMSHEKMEDKDRK